MKAAVAPPPLACNDDCCETWNNLLQIALETGWLADKSTWVVDEAKQTLTSWMLSVLGYVYAQFFAKLLVS